MARVLVYSCLNSLEAVEGVCGQRKLWSDLALLLTLSGSNYPYLEQIPIVLNMFEPLIPYWYQYFWTGIINFGTAIRRLILKFSIYLNRHIFVMLWWKESKDPIRSEHTKTTIRTTIEQTTDTDIQTTTFWNRLRKEKLITKAMLWTIFGLTFTTLNLVCAEMMCNLSLTTLI